MKRRNFIGAGIALVLLLVALSISFGLFSSSKPPLTVHLRCDEKVSGKLSVAMIPSDGESAKTENFDVKAVCKTGKIELSNYRREKNLQFVFERDNGETSQLTSEYDRNIQSDQNGFQMILKITDTPPFIANDKL